MVSEDCPTEGADLEGKDRAGAEAELGGVMHWLRHGAVHLLGGGVLAGHVA